MRRTTRTTRADRQRILAKIDAIPHDALAETDAARYALWLIANDGVVDMAVYQQAVTNAWVIWLRPADPADHGRHTLDEWRRDYAQLTREALARQAGKGSAA